MNTFCKPEINKSTIYVIFKMWQFISISCLYLHNSGPQFCLYTSSIMINQEKFHSTQTEVFDHSWINIHILHKRFLPFGLDEIMSRLPFHYYYTHAPCPLVANYSVPIFAYSEKWGYQNCMWNILTQHE